MKLEIYGNNYNPSDSLKAITEKKSAKLARRLKDDDNALVKYTVTLENGIYSTDLTVATRGLSYRAEVKSSSPFDNIDTVIPKLLGQMRKQKDIWGRNKKGSPNVYADSED